MARTITRRFGSTVEIRYTDAPLWSPEGARQVLTDKARVFFSLALQHLAGYVSDEAPVGVSGNLAQSWGHSPATSMGGQEVMGGSYADLQGRVFSGLPYAIVIDQGRAPGARMPPVDALISWVQRVLHVGGSESEIRSVAFLVARAIGKKGIKPRDFVSAGVEKATPDLEAIFQAMADAMAAGLTGGGGVTPAPGGVGI